jgi:hypothetical protein
MIPGHVTLDTTSLWFLVLNEKKKVPPNLVEDDVKLPIWAQFLNLRRKVSLLFLIYRNSNPGL